MPPDADVLNAFVLSGSQSQLTDDEIARLRPMVHHGYLQQMLNEQKAREAKRRADPKLQAEFDRSSREQIHDMAAKLRRIGRTAARVDGRAPIVILFSDPEIEQLARMEHGRFVVERVAAGRALGPSSDAKRQRLSLVEWDALSEEEKDKNKQAVQRIPELLASVGYEVVRA